MGIVELKIKEEQDDLFFFTAFVLSDIPLMM